MQTSREFALTIAGLDPSGGAGIIADCKTFEQCGVHGLGVCSALTFQNDMECDGVEWLSFKQIENQLIPLCRRFHVSWIKLGLVQSLEAVLQLLELISREASGARVVWDPILKASAGFEFHGNIDQEILKKVLPRIFLLTPNYAEACALSAAPDPYAGAAQLSNFCAVYLKGGHGDGEILHDVLFRGGLRREMSAQRIKAGAKHGSGCVFSAALLSFLAQGFDLEDACKHARAYIRTFMASSETLLGIHAEDRIGGNGDSEISIHHSRM